ncbi:unnamed protein product, partial [Leptidea sinapis]
MATLGLSKVFILDKYFTELQKFWETEKKLQDASSSNEAVHLQRRLLSLSSELVTLRNHLHVGAGAGPGAPGPSGCQPAVPPGAPGPSGCQPAVPPRAPLLLAPPAPPLPHQPQAPPQPPGSIVLALNAYTDTTNALTPSAARAQRPELARLVHDAVRHQGDTGCPQAIILSGVSGSGKTYASMALLRRLFDVAGGGPETDAFKHLAAAFTVLRSLGTAATRANSNSSRIGHFIEVQVTDGALYRTKIHCYFLDQTRVVRPPAGERNYHIFYQMLAGLTADERSQLHLDGYSPQDLRYLAATAPGAACGPLAPLAPDGEQAARFQAWRSCLGVLGIPFLDVVRVLAAVLLLGNAELAAAGALLGVGAAALVRGAGWRVAPRGARSPARAPATPAAAARARDALAKALYCRTVATIVRRANSLKRLGSTLGTLSSDSNESSSAEACREEGVWASTGALEVEYVDNVPCIDLVSSLRSGLLATLDAECAARGSPEHYVARIEAAHRGHPRLGEARGGRRFAVRHYAGEVTYDASDFLDANRDAVPDDLIAAFDTRHCEFGFATHLFGAELKALAAAGGATGAWFRASPTAAGATAAAAGAGSSTLTQDFHTRLDNLLRTLVHARPHFVRCLRANSTETPMLFDRKTVAAQ